MRRAVSFLLLSVLLTTLGCSTTPPANWTRGGAPIEVPNARWSNGIATIIVAPNGNVYRDGELDLHIDRAGRVYDTDNRAVALLEPNGKVSGPDDDDLGNVGALNAGLADQPYAWISVTPEGVVYRFDEDGKRYDFGIWLGCGRSMQSMTACVLLTHVYALRFNERERRGGGSGVTMGLGATFVVGP
jgi:hypothetical protein